MTSICRLEPPGRRARRNGADVEWPEEVAVQGERSVISDGSLSIVPRERLRLVGFVGGGG